ncbi:hypothetical protein TrRE_jg2807, partial [Triparma retinervis]
LMRFFLFLLLAHTAIANTLTEGCVNAPDGVPITNKNPARASTTCSQIQAKFEQKKALNDAQPRVAQFYRNHCDPSNNWKNSAVQCCETCGAAAEFIGISNYTPPPTSSPTDSPTTPSPTASPTAAPTASPTTTPPTASPTTTPPTATPTSSPTQCTDTLGDHTSFNGRKKTCADFLTKGKYKLDNERPVDSYYKRNCVRQDIWPGFNVLCCASCAELKILISTSAPTANEVIYGNPANFVNMFEGATAWGAKYAYTKNTPSNVCNLIAWGDPNGPSLCWTTI